MPSSVGTAYACGPDVRQALCSDFQWLNVWSRSPCLRRVGYVIANVKLNCTVELNPKVLASTIGMNLREVNEAIEYLCAEDKESRTKDEGGRRLLHDGGYLYTVVNAGKYRGIRNEEERREYMRLKKREQRRKEREPGDDDD